MKKYIIYLLLISFVVSNSCEDYLDTRSLTDLNSTNFYSTPEQIDAALGGIYNALYIQVPKNNPDLISNILSDDMFAGGGPDDKYIKNIENWKNITEDAHLGTWKAYFKGISRANVMINNFDKVDYRGDNDAKNQALGETHVMRAFFYFRLAKMFGGLPLLTDPNKNPNQSRASFDDTFALIASDLKKAIKIMPKTPFVPSSSGHGHANVWVAEALMARVYLFYTGYSTNVLNVAKEALPLTDGGSVTKENVKEWLGNMIENSGHGLINDPRRIWPYANTPHDEYPYAKTENLTWAEEKNEEIVFVVRYGVPQTGNAWSNEGRSYVNNLSLFYSIRGNNLTPFGTGWGWGTVNPDLWNTYGDRDVRKQGFIIKVGEANEGTANYKGGKGDHETGYFNKKYTNVQYKKGGKGLQGMFFHLYKGQDNFMLRCHQDQILIRYADVLLMAAELGVNPQANLDAVRVRAGATSVAPTLDNIKRERRLELCFEGLRYYDLLRWGDVKTALTSTNLQVGNSGKKELYKGVYREETKGLLPIPESQVRLSNGVLTQNPGW